MNVTTCSLSPLTCNLRLADTACLSHMRWRQRDGLTVLLLHPAVDVAQAGGRMDGLLASVPSDVSRLILEGSGLVIVELNKSDSESQKIYVKLC